MIRQANLHDIQQFAAGSEAAVRILGLVKAYGIDKPFLRLWCSEGQNDEKCLISLLDGATVVAFANNSAVTDELTAFLSMQHDIKSIRTSADAVRVLATQGDWTMETGAVMTPGTVLQAPKRNPVLFSPRETYPLLSACFGDTLPPFSSWYVDVSHRIRHGCCRIVGFKQDNQPVSCAMTTSECEGAALIGAVATIESGRGKGYASANVLTLAHELIGEGRQVLLSPKNEYAHALYARIGFIECGQWGSLKRI